MKYFGGMVILGMLNSFKHYNPIAVQAYGPDPPRQRGAFCLLWGRSYEGHAYVLFTCDDTLWEVESSHCSCNGLEGTWRPTVTTWAAQGLRGPSHWKKPIVTGGLVTMIKRRKMPFSSWSPNTLSSFQTRRDYQILRRGLPLRVCPLSYIVSYPRGKLTLTAITGALP
jgi:hypothetical protein